MNNLIIQPTEHTPEIVFDVENLLKGKYIFEISGESKPEDVQSFYEPVLRWIDELRNNLKAFEDKAHDNRKRKIRLKFKMAYFNSSSAKFLYDIVRKMEEIQEHCHNASIKIVWIYHPKDLDMLDAGEEFKSMTTIPFELSMLKPGESNKNLHF